MAALSNVCRKQRTYPMKRDVIFPPNFSEHMRRLTPNEKTILKAQKFVLNNLSENIQLSDVADHCYVSHTHLSRMFKEIRGITFKQFLLRARVDRALELLEDRSYHS